MRAAVLKTKDSYTEIDDNFSLPMLVHTEEVELKAAALNHRDYWIFKGLYAGITYPIILGSDGCGIMDGKEVVINPGLHWGAKEAYQSEDFQVLGLPSHGTFAERILIPKEYIYPKPDHLNVLEAAALPLAGVTAFRGLFTKAKLTSKDKILINGIGGGVALMAFQFALAIGCDIYVTSSSDEKIKEALRLGAKAGFNYKSDDYLDQLKKQSIRFDVIFDGAAGKSLASLFTFCDYGARVVVYGGTTGRISELSPQVLFWRQVQIFGTTMGSDKDFQDMLDFVTSYKIRPIIDSTYKLDEIRRAFERMESGAQFGKIVISI